MGKSTIRQSARQRWSAFYASIWFFPVICLVVVLLLSVCRISGSSVGLYNQIFYGVNHADSNLIANHPRSVRSDEILFITPTAIAQTKQNFPQVNQLTGNGQDVSVIVDTPYTDWSTLFRPQNLPFFFLPLEIAFAMRWWLIGFLLIVSCYFFCLALLPKRRLWAALIAVSLFFAPFIQWWYQTITLAPLFYSFFIAIVGMKLLAPTTTIKTKIVLGGVLNYLLVAFALLLYPPFQIPCVMAVALFLAGYTLETYHRSKLRALWQSLGVMISSLIIALGFVALFLKTRSDVVQAITNTAYPGKRTVQNGGYSWRNFFGSPFGLQLQSDSRAATFYTNQSEASNFILLSPYLFITSAVISVRKWLQQRRLPWTLIGLNLLLALFMARLLVPHGNALTHLLHLDTIPHSRLLIGIGLVGIMQLVLIIRDQRFRLRPLWAGGIGGGASLISYLAGQSIHQHYPQYLSNSVEIIALSLLVGVIVWLVQGTGRQITVGLSLLAFLAIISGAGVNPLYRGLAAATDNPVSRAVQSIGGPQDTWAVADSRALVTIPQINNRRSMTGVYTYPQPTVWKGTVNSGDSDIYNRYAHVTLAIDPTLQPATAASLDWKADDYFTVHVTPCSTYLKQHVQYLLTPNKFDSPCATRIQTIQLPSSPYYVYKIKH